MTLGRQLSAHAPAQNRRISVTSGEYAQGSVGDSVQRAGVQNCSEWMSAVGDVIWRRDLCAAVIAGISVVRLDTSH